MYIAKFSFETLHAQLSQMFANFNRGTELLMMMKPAIACRGWEPTHFSPRFPPKGGEFKHSLPQNTPNVKIYDMERVILVDFSPTTG